MTLRRRFAASRSAALTARPRPLRCLLAPLVGSTPIHLARVFDRSIPFADNVDAQIFFVARLPRVLAAALVGSGWRSSGVVFQALLRNPLASPDTLGVSAGAALGAMLAITFHAGLLAPRRHRRPLASFAGSLGAIGIVYGVVGRAASRHVRARPAARPASRCSALVGDHRVRPVPRRLHGDVRPCAG